MNQSIRRLLLVSILACASLPSAFAVEPAAVAAVAPAVARDRAIAVVWRDSGAKGRLVVRRGQLAPRGAGLSPNGSFDCGQSSRLELSVAGADTLSNAERTLITVQTDTNPFTFFLNDVRRDQPIFIPAFGVAVTEAGDGRTYQQIAAAVQAHGLRSDLGRIEAEPEETFARAAPAVRVQKVETWLGLGRDLRLFGVSPRLEWIQPRYPSGPVRAGDQGAPQLQMMLGRGWGAGEDIQRRLDEGVLPILQASKVDADITYRATFFTSFEQTPLRSDTVRGTHYLVADGFGIAHMLTPEQQAEFDRLKPGELNRPEETVLYARVVATNTGAVPRYAFVKVPTGPRGWNSTPAHWQYKFDGSRGWSQLTNGNVYLVGKLNGRPLPQEEVSLLLFPGESATVDFCLPHQPIPAERATALAGQNFDTRLEEARAYWRGKLDRAAKMRVPEARINEMIQAGLLHLDIITYGLEPKGSLSAHVGIYNAIGSESSPIIQFMDSMGWHDVAGRALQSFLDKQHADGFMQNLGDYMLETGCVLWSLGEHYRYTRDLDWVRGIKPKMLKSAQYLREWRRRNQREELRGKGYGLLDGKVADPEDPFRSYMLNGYTYLGFARVAEMLETIDPAEARVWREEAAGLKRDLRISFFETMAKSPVVPLGDGTWVPTAPPWADYSGPVLLQADGGIWYSHGTVTARDSLLGPLYLLFQEVIAPDEPAASFLLSYHNELMTSRNAGYSQPYYSRHDWAHLQRGEVKPFLKTYYNTVASMADRETYTFWEHYFTASPHKTHEEGWFLMQTRWMLYLERGDTLSFLRGVPRSYLAGDQQIDLTGVATYFGPASLHVATTADQRRISAHIECKSDRQPRTVEIRLPHPAGLRPQSVKGGTYDAATETVRIESFSGTAEVELTFAASATQDDGLAGTDEAQITDVAFTAAVDGTEQRYVLMLPAGFKADQPHDLLIALHGHGSDRWQFVRDPRDECRAARDVAAAHDMIYVSPDYRAKTSWMGPKAEADVVQIIGELKNTHRVARVFLCGGSMGGTSSLTFTALHPEFVDGVAAMNGTANHVEYANFQDAIAASFGGSKTEIPAEYRKRSAEFWPERFTMPVGITACGKDAIVPPHSVVRLANIIKASGRDLLLIYREDGGHSTNYDDVRAILEFVIQKARKQF